MWVFDTETLRFLAVNRAAVNTYGYTEDEFLAMTIRDIRPGAEQERLDNLLDTPRNFTMAGLWKHRRKDGCVIDVEIISHRFPFENYNARLVLINDITQKKKAQEEITKLALVAQRTDNSVVITDAHFRIEWVNEGFTRLTGYTAEEAAGKLPRDLLSGPASNQETVKQMYQTLQRGEPFSTEILSYGKNSRPYWSQLSIQPIFDQQGVLKQYISVESDITDRKKWEEQLYFQATVLKNVKDSVIVADLDGTVRYYNQGSEAIYGYSSEEILGASAQILYPADRRNQFFADMDLYRQNKEFEGEWEGQRKDGQPVWVNLHISLMRDASGEPTGLISVARDISRWRLAEEKWRESRNHLRSIFDSTAQPYFLFDKEFRIIQFNRAAANAIQQIFSRELTIGEKILSYGNSAITDDFIRHANQAFTGERVVVTREVSLTPGQRQWFELDYLPAFNEEGQIYAVAFVVLDITERKRTELALRKSFQEIRNFQNALNESALISITDLDGRIQEANAAFCKAVRYSREELIGKKHSLINAGFHPDSFFADMWQTISTGNSWRGEIMNRARNNTFFWVDTTITPILDEQGTITRYLAVQYLITERKQAEQDRENLIANLTDFAFMTAHNLRGPLARILGLVSLFDPLQQDTELNNTVMDKLKVCAGELDQVIHHMIAVLNQRTDLFKEDK